MAKEETFQVQGKVTAALANTQFKVKLENGHEIIAHIAGKMRMKFLRILPAMCAMISCPFSRRTRNCVLAKAATTFPCTWIDSSFAINTSTMSLRQP